MHLLLKPLLKDTVGFVDDKNLKISKNKTFGILEMVKKATLNDEAVWCIVTNEKRDNNVRKRRIYK